MRILVTGGTGHVGRPVVTQLAGADHEVTVLSRHDRQSSLPGLRFVRGDLRRATDVARVLEEAQPEALVHLAWDGLPDYSLDLCLRNFDDSVRLLQAASDAGCRCLLSTGSCWEYASRQGELDESAPLGAHGVFPIVKNALQQIGGSIAARAGGRFYWLRLFFVYGPGQRGTSLLPQLIEALAHGRAPQVRTPANRHDFVYVDDVARAIAAVVTHQPAPGVYNVGSGSPVAVQDVVGLIHRLLGQPAPAHPAAGLADQDFWADISRLRQATGWTPAYNIEAGVRATLAASGLVPTFMHTRAL